MTIHFGVPPFLETPMYMYNKGNWLMYDVWITTAEIHLGLRVVSRKYVLVIGFF